MKTKNLVWIAVLAIGWAVPSSAQNTLRDPAAPVSFEGQPVPTIPVADPRPLQGTKPEQQWNPAPARAPVAGFVDSLRSNDALVEVIMGQGRLLTLRGEVASRNGMGAIAVGDPSIVEFEVLPNPKMIRLLGRRPGITDLSITATDGQTYSFEVRVLYELELLRAQLRQTFPDASLKLTQIRDHVVVEGEARTTAQVADILQVVGAFVTRLDHGQEANLTQTPGIIPGPPMPSMGQQQLGGASVGSIPGTPQAPSNSNGGGGGGAGGGDKVAVHIINLIHVPGVRQVLLQVRVAELNRTATREIGADMLGVNPDNGTIVGTSIAGSSISAAGILGLGGLSGNAAGTTGTSQTVFGIFPGANFAVLIRALRDNQLLSILAEPNLVAMDGQHANFLAGGQFPVPIPQNSGSSGSTVTVEFKNFGVELDFIPHVLNDGTIRLTVTPEVSSIDFALGTTLVQGGSPVPGLDTRRATTTVELGQGQTLAIAGLMQVEVDGRTSRIPGLGDLPVIGAMFSNTSQKRVEKELVVLVTPYLVNPMNPGQVPATPGDEVKDPTDLEFFLMNRIENRNCRDYRSTLGWDNPWAVGRQMKIQRDCAAGPVGFSH